MVRNRTCPVSLFFSGTGIKKNQGILYRVILNSSVSLLTLLPMSLRLQKRPKLDNCNRQSNQIQSRKTKIRSRLDPVFHKFCRRHRFDAEPDSDTTFHFDAYPDPDPDPTPILHMLENQFFLLLFTPQQCKIIILVSAIDWRHNIQYLDKRH